MRVLISRIFQRTCQSGLVFAAILLMASTSFAQGHKPLSQQQVLGLLQGGVASQRIAYLVGVRGIDFEVTPDLLQTLKDDGAEKTLLDALQQANRQVSPQAEIFAEKNHQAKEEVAQGKNLLDRKLWAQAEGVLRKAIQLDPTDPAAHFYLGHALSEEKQWDQAVAEYRETILLAPDSAPAHCNLGNALLAKHDLKEAIEQYQEALSLDSKDEKAAYGLGVVFYHQGNLPAAVKQFRTSVALEPTDTDAVCALGLTLFRQNDLAGALKQYQHALKLNPSSAMAHAGLAYVLLKKGQRQEALHEFQEAASLAPEDMTYRSSYAKLRRELNP